MRLCSVPQCGCGLTTGSTTGLTGHWTDCLRPNAPITVTVHFPFQFGHVTAANFISIPFC
jgi:hypothetical protein